MLISASFDFFLADLIRRSVLPVPDRKRPRIRDGADPTFVGSVPKGWFWIYSGFDTERTWNLRSKGPRITFSGWALVAPDLSPVSPIPRILALMFSFEEA